MDAIIDTLKDNWGKLAMLAVGSGLLFGLIRLFSAFSAMGSLASY